MKRSPKNSQAAAMNHNLITSIRRRQFLAQGTAAAGAAALATLLKPRAAAAAGLAGLPHLAPKAKRIIWLTQSGAPSQFELFDPKPKLNEMFSTELPDSVRRGQRLTGMTAGARHPIAPSIYKFEKHGRCGMELSELVPFTSQHADDICLVRTMFTEAINHDPAMTLLQTGHQIAGRPSFGSWIAYGLGSENQNLPAFVVLVSLPSGGTNSQPLAERMWGSGFLPAKYQGVHFNSGKDPVLYLSNPDGITTGRRRAMLDDLGELNRMKLAEQGDPEIQTRIDQFEMAFRMQSSVPELADLSKEPPKTFESYGPESRQPGTYAANCLLARRLAERGVRFIQLYHRGWDQHAALPKGIKSQCYDTDQPTAALLDDLKERGMFNETLIVWGGEFGRTVYSQGALTKDNYGRDHHPRCYSLWVAGAGIKRGHVIGETDDFSYNIVKDPVHIHDLNATLMQQLGIEHTRFTFRHQGRDYRLTDVHGGFVKDMLA
jgi:hypothetical protein